MSKPAGGIKGFLQKTGRLGMWAIETGNSLLKWTFRYGGQSAFVLATTSMVVLMPLLFEITREGQVRQWLDLIPNSFLFQIISSFCCNELAPRSRTHRSKRSSEKGIHRSAAHGIGICGPGVALPLRFYHDYSEIIIKH